MEVRKVFNSLLSRRVAAPKLLQLSQDSRNMADYAVYFRTLVAESAWNLEALFDAFLHGLSEVIKDELAAQELPMDLDYLIGLTIRIDGQLRERRRERVFPVDLACPQFPPCLRGFLKIPKVSISE